MQFDGPTESQDMLVTQKPGWIKKIFDKYRPQLTGGSRAGAHIATIISGLGLGGFSEWRFAAGALGLFASLYLMAVLPVANMLNPEIDEKEKDIINERSKKIYTSVILVAGLCLAGSGIALEHLFEFFAGGLTAAASSLKALPENWTSRVTAKPMKVGADLKQVQNAASFIDSVTRKDWGRLASFALMGFSNWAERGLDKKPDDTQAQGR